MYLQNYSCISYISDMDQVIASGRTNNDSLNRTHSSPAQTQICSSLLIFATNFLLTVTF